MLDYTYKIDNDNFEGQVVIGIMPYRERIKLLKTMNLKANSDGSLNFTELDQFDMLDKMYDLAEKNIKKLEVKHKETGKEFTSIESLSYSQEGSELINELSSVIMNGVRLGKM